MGILMNAAGRTIFIIEDDEDIREPIAECLSSDGYTIFTAPDGLTALEKLKQIPRPNLILLDLFMPGMNGLEFLKVMKNERTAAEIPVVLMSASPLQGDLAKEAAPYVSGFLKKPLSLDDLMNVVAEFCRD